MLGICFFINLFDGLDLFAMAYAAPVLSETWSLPPESLGIVLSAVFVGMAAGAVLVGPLCDYIGRRKIVLGGTLLISFAMLLTATATSVTELLIYRVLTGLGFGATLPGITSLVAEYSPERFRNMAVSSLHVAAPAGSILGGVLAAAIITRFGWQSIFVVSGTLTLITAVTAMFLLPESPEFLLADGSSKSLSQLNAILKRVGHPPLDPNQARPATTDNEAVGLRALFQDQHALWSPLLWLSCFCILASLYFVMSWLPKVLVDAGLSLNLAIYISVVNSIGAIIGLLAMGLLSNRFGLRRLQRWSFLTAFMLMIVFGFCPPSVPLLALVAFGIGVCMSGAYISIWITAVRIYAARARHGDRLDHRNRPPRRDPGSGDCRHPDRNGMVARLEFQRLCAAAVDIGRRAELH